ncbi:hypothetical protein EDB86DRAFT_381368 [Lactarius hatsudake]|nr:hypothetical protein EDB86DRAFT_381368 [Lactarius hatsudake]
MSYAVSGEQTSSVDMFFSLSRSFFAHAHSLGILTAPPTELVPTLGGSGGGAITHVMHNLRETVGPGDTVRARTAPGPPLTKLTKVESERPSVTKNVCIRQLPRVSTATQSPCTKTIHIIPFSSKDYAPSRIPISPSSRFSHQTAPDAGLPSADEKFLARVRLT